MNTEESSGLERYQYKRLKLQDGELDEIRLARVKPGTPGEIIRVVIETFSLKAIGFTGPRDKTRLIWHALSYTWGDLTDQVQVLVDPPREDTWAGGDKPLATYLTVMRSLVDVLDVVRDQHDDRLLWIDAICIDQGTDIAARNERELQVKRMYQIYSQAFGVIVWIGHEDNDSTYALHLLDSLGASIRVNWETFDIFTPDDKPTIQMQHWDDGVYGPSSREAKALWDLLGRAWFFRTWIRQEILLADEQQSVLLCGSTWIRLANFRKAMHFLNHARPSLIEPSAEDDWRLNLVTTLCERTYVDEANVMNQARSARCYDARDKIYGALGTLRTLGDARFADSIKVDYSPLNSVGQVYIDFMKCHHERYGTPRLLSEGGLRQNSPMRPTWVPDWTCKINFMDLSMESATSYFAFAECNFHPNNILEVHGTSAAKVIAVLYLPPEQSSHDGTEHCHELDILIKRIISSVGEAPDPMRIAYALCTPLNGLRVDLSVIEKYRRSFLRYVQYLFGRINSTTSELLAPEDVAGEEAAYAVDSCIPFFRSTQMPILICDHGYIGVGPQGAQTGDIVTALLGSCALILLRRHGDSDHQLVGPCYAHGLNWGEALLGPLPHGYTVVSQQEPGKIGYKPHYHNRVTNETSIFDPRIVWEELKPHPPMLTWAPAAPNTDPMRIRPDSSYLLRHGVVLERFMLV